MNAATTLILGGTGKTGRRVASRLAARGAPFRVASRAGSPRFEWSDRSTWEPILRGATSIYLAYPPDLGVPQAEPDVRALSELAVHLGVRRIVLLSGRGEEHVLASERAVAESGARWTVLRCAWFAQNFDEGHLLPSIQQGELALPGGTVGEPFVDLDDVADVAVAALTSDAHEGAIYELTGPRLVTFAEAMAEIGRATGRSVRYAPVDKEAYAEIMRTFMPADEAGYLSELFTYLLDGHNAHVADGVQRALGRPARDFSDYVRAAAASGIWNAALAS